MLGKLLKGVIVALRRANGQRCVEGEDLGDELEKSCDLPGNRV